MLANFKTNKSFSVAGLEIFSQNGYVGVTRRFLEVKTQDARGIILTFVTWTYLPLTCVTIMVA